jgi:hypothetical protein
MTEIGTERLEPTAQVTERASNEDLRERGPRPRRRPAVAPDPQPEPADRSEIAHHQVDSLA